MFNDDYGLTQAVLEGRKTMTRRIATALNHPNITDISEWGVDNNGNAMLLITYDTGLETAVYPHFQIGDEVAVAQRYKDVIANSDESVWQFLVEKGLMQSGGAIDIRLCTCAGYDNKIFVAAGHMPHHIRITNIKAEHLQDISDEDCLREGILQSSDGIGYTFDGWKKRYRGGIFSQILYASTPRAAFAALIDKISGRGTWERNPRVFAYEFELIK